jgi:hypothetical protein
VPTINALAERWHALTTFVFVYIEEAHAVDEWPIREAPREFKQHRTLAERLTAARALQSDCALDPRITLLADGMDNSFNARYASWPFRFWVIRDQHIQFKPMPNDAKYDVNELELWLRENVESPQRQDK